MKLLTVKPALKYGVFLLLSISCSSFGQLANSCGAVFSTPSSQYLEWTYYSFVSGVKGTTLPGKEVRGKPLPENPPGEITHIYYKNTFRFGSKDSTYSQSETTTKGNETWESTQDILKFAYKIYAQRGTVPHSWLKNLKKMDKELSPYQTSYISFSDPVSHETRMVVRIVDGSPTHRTRHVMSPGKIPIELEYPHLELPERKEGNNDIIEFGRLAKDDQHIEGDIVSLLRPLAMYVQQAHYYGPAPQRKGHEPVIYIEASAGGARLYSKFGFKRVFGPKDVNAPDTYILRMGGDELVSRYYGINSFYLAK